eukprot:4111788-Prymnesium_polylepis.1
MSSASRGLENQLFNLVRWPPPREAAARLGRSTRRKPRWTAKCRFFKRVNYRRRHAESET